MITLGTNGMARSKTPASVIEYAAFGLSMHNRDVLGLHSVVPGHGCVFSFPRFTIQLYEIQIRHRARREVDRDMMRDAWWFRARVMGILVVVRWVRGFG